MEGRSGGVGGEKKERGERKEKDNCHNQSRSKKCLAPEMEGIHLTGQPILTNLTAD